jgi:hypothetical protein
MGQKKTVKYKEYNDNGVLEDEWLSDTDDNITVDKFSTLWYPTDVYNSVSVFSDGLKTLFPHDRTKPYMPIEQVVKELTAFPVVNGDFVKRRCLKFMKTHPDHAFYDDFSMATYIKD